MSYHYRIDLLLSDIISLFLLPFNRISRISISSGRRIPLGYVYLSSYIIAFVGTSIVNSPSKKNPSEWLAPIITSFDRFLPGGFEFEPGLLLPRTSSTTTMFGDVGSLSRYRRCLLTKYLPSLLSSFFRILVLIKRYGEATGHPHSVNRNHFEDLIPESRCLGV